METLIDHLEKRKQYLINKFGISSTFKTEDIVTLMKKEYNINVETLDFLGSGSFGVAYGEYKILGQDRVIKITTDPDEVSISKKLVGKKNKNLADIYGVHHVSKDLYLIIQERLLTNSETIKDSVEKLINILDEFNLSFPEVVCFDMLDEVLEEEDGEFYFLSQLCCEFSAKIVKSAYAACLEVFEKSSYHADDFHLFNFGLKNNGNIGFFDHTINKIEEYV